MNALNSVSRVLIKMPGDGNCLYNSVLVGFVDASSGQYPVIDGEEIRTQEALRKIVQNYYQNEINNKNGLLIEILKNMLKGIVISNEFSGFNNFRSLLNRLKEIRSEYSKEHENSNILNDYVDNDLIQLYVDGIGTIWGGGQECLLLRDLLDKNIRFSSDETLPAEDDIIVDYVNGNHFNVYVKDPLNNEVRLLVNTINGEVNKNINLFNKNSSINPNSINNLSSKYTKSTYEDIKPTMLKFSDDNNTMTREKSYQLYYDDTSSEEDDQETINSTSIGTIEDLISTTQIQFKGISEIDLTLSFLAHEFGIRLLKSKEVDAYYYPLKQTYLAKNIVLDDKTLKDCINRSIQATLIQLYNEKHGDILQTNKELIGFYIEDVLKNKRKFIREINKNQMKMYSELEKLELPSVKMNITWLSLVDIMYGVYEASGVTFSPGESKFKTRIVFSEKKKDLINKYASKLQGESIEKKAAEILYKQTSSENLKNVALQWHDELKKKRYNISTSFISVLHSKLSENLKNAHTYHEICRETLPNTFDISLLDAKDNIEKFLAYIRLMTKSAIRMIKNLNHQKSILDDELETMIRTFSFFGLNNNKGIEKQTIYKKTGSRSDFVEIAKIRNSGSYESIGNILENLKSELKIKDKNIADWMKHILRGQSEIFQSKIFSSQIQVKKSAKIEAEKFINSLVYLLFGTEVARNPACLVIHFMIIDLIIAKEMTWKDAFDGAMPMSIKEAVPASRSLHNKYQTSLQYSYDNATNNEGNDAIITDLITKEAKIFKKWLKKVKNHNVSGSTTTGTGITNIIDFLTKECFSWYGISLRSKHLMIDILIDIFKDEISVEDLCMLSMDQLNTLEEITVEFDIDVVLRLYSDGKVLSMEEIVELYMPKDKTLKERFSDLSDKTVIEFFEQLQEREPQISFDDICEMYDNSTEDFFDFINNEGEDNLIYDYGWRDVSNTYYDIFEKCGGYESDYTGYNKENGEKYVIYSIVYDRLLNPVEDEEEEEEDVEEEEYNSDESEY